MELPPIPPGESLSISASTYVAYRQCPAMAAARLRGFYGPDSIPAFRGALAHAVFARHLDGGPIEPSEFTQVCYESIGGSNLNYKLSPLGLKPSSLKGVIAEVHELYDRFRRLPVEGFSGAEVALTYDAGNGLTLAGRIDAVFGADSAVRLVDWKTGDLGEVLEQLRFYALLWALIEGAVPSAVEAFSVRTGEQYRDLPTEADVGATAARVAEMVTSLRSAWERQEDVDRTAGPWCRHCPILDDCSEGRAAIRVAEAG
ncbi:MAG: PD-(D/E)XK nuclease family protein [Acidimicrobiia bacterium]|nr:PD-(D/E)XK nuclease family protein [Acidimicrobiia bacterium]